MTKTLKLKTQNPDMHKAQIKHKAQNTKSKHVFDLFRASGLGFRVSRAARGFTLLEMMISTGIFAVVIITAVGAMISLNQAQVKATNIQHIQDNLRFTLESMTKELRTGTDFETSQCGAGGCEQIKFTRQDGAVIRYCLDNGVVKKRIVPPANCASGSPITSPEVSIQKLFFYAIGSDPGPSDGQPRITVTIEAVSVNPTLRLETSFDLQTTVTARLRDL